MSRIEILGANHYSFSNHLECSRKTS